MASHFINILLITAKLITLKGLISEIVLKNVFIQPLKV